MPQDSYQCSLVDVNNFAVSHHHHEDESERSLRTHDLRYDGLIAGPVKENNGGGACGVHPVRPRAPDSATAL